MSKGKKPSNPTSKMVKPPPPASTYTDLGNALWSRSKNGYVYEDVPFQGLAEDQAVQQQNLYGRQLDYLQDPNAIRQEQEGVYRSAMIPAFESERNKIIGQARAQLGNRYKSTYGALTMEDAANKQAVQRAGLERTIYDSGQSALDRELARLGLLQGQASQQVASAYAPMIALKDIQQGGSANFGNYVQGLGNYNNAMAQNYATQANMYNNSKDFMNHHLQMLGANGQISQAAATGGM